MSPTRAPTSGSRPSRGAGAADAGLDRVLAASVAWLVLVTAVTVLGWIFGDALPFVDDPGERNAAAIKAGPSWAHWFGNAGNGEDVFSQVVVGGRLTLCIAVLVTAIGIALGGAVGLAAGYLRGWVDAVARLVVNVALSVPALLLVIFVVTIRGRSLTTVVLALSLLAVPALARVVRANTLQVAERDYIRAAEVIGSPRRSIVVREVLPNVMPALVSFAFLTIGIVIVAESSLSFLGLSVDSASYTWGSIIAEGRIAFADTPHQVFLPALVIFATVLSLNLVGDRLLRRYDVRESAL